MAIKIRVHGRMKGSNCVICGQPYGYTLHTKGLCPPCEAKDRVERKRAEEKAKQAEK